VPIIFEEEEEKKEYEEDSDVQTAYSGRRSVTEAGKMPVLPGQSRA
jgi:hypothetical protein